MAASLDITLRHILESVAAFKQIKNFELKFSTDVHVGEGFISNFYLGDIVDKDGGKTICVAIKKVPPSKKDNLAVLYKNEISFYTKLVPVFKELHPQFDNVAEFFTSSLEPNNEYLAMENLKVRNYVLYNQQKYFDREHLELVFKVYGKFHALSFILKNRDETCYQDINSSLTSLFKYMLQSRVDSLTRCLLAAANALDKDTAIYQVAKNLGENTKQVFLKVCDYSGPYKCFTHGDCWSNNLLFRYSEFGKVQDVKMVDFQMARESTPIHDLSYFFYSGAAKGDMDRLQDYLKIYYRAFSEVLKSFNEEPEEIFPYNVLIDEWKDNCLLGVILGLYLWQVKLLPKESYEKDVKRSSGEREEVIKILYKYVQESLESESYREKARALLTHAYEIKALRSEVVDIV